MIGSFGEVLVLDWGIAQPAHCTGSEAGTPGFMPETDSGPRGDVYSLGHLLSLRPMRSPSPALRSIIRKCIEPEAPKRMRGMRANWRRTYPLPRSRARRGAPGECLGIGASRCGPPSGPCCC